MANFLNFKYEIASNVKSSKLLFVFSDFLKPFTGCYIIAVITEIVTTHAGCIFGYVFII